MRNAIFNDGFVAERCQDWGNGYGMCPPCGRTRDKQKSFVVPKCPGVVEPGFGWLAHWGELLRDRAERIGVSAACIAFAAVLSGVEALLNPMPLYAAES